MNNVEQNDVRKIYTAPKLESYGGVQELTQASGSSSANDLVIVGGTTFGGASGFTTGSGDIVIP